MGWLETTELVTVTLALVVIVPVLALVLRRLWLARQGGMFECGLRRRPVPGARGWSLGAARYNGEYLEWFRAASLSFSPRVRLRRSVTAAVEAREPRDEEAIGVFPDARVVRLESTPETGEPVVVELTMDAGSATGLLAWLESRPPSVDRFSA